MTAPSVQSPIVARIGAVSISERVRLRTLTMLKGRDGIGMPIDASTASLRTDVRPVVGKKKPLEHIYRICMEAIGAGANVDRVTLFLDEMKEDFQQAAARRDRHALGVIPFRQSYARLAAHGCTEEGEANAATMVMDENDAASIEKARCQLLDEIAVDQAKVERLTARLVELGASR